MGGARAVDDLLRMSPPLAQEYGTSRLATLRNLTFPWSLTLVTLSRLRQSHFLTEVARGRRRWMSEGTHAALARGGHGGSMLCG